MTGDYVMCPKCRLYNCQHDATEWLCPDCGWRENSPDEATDPRQEPTATPVGVQEIATWGDLWTALGKLSAEQLEMPAQVIRENPCATKVLSGKPAVCIGTVDALDLRYVRSCRDNRRHGEEIVLLVDGNPFAKDGAIGYKGMDLQQPIYPGAYTKDQDWTGPAKELVDAEKPMKPLNDTAWIKPVAKHRHDAYERNK